MKYNIKDFTLAIETLLRNSKAKSVIVFQGSKGKIVQRIKITRYGKSANDLRISFGKLNYSEREYVKKLVKGKFPVPQVKTIQYKAKISK